MNNERFCVSTGLQLPWKTRCTRTTDQQRQVSSKNEHVHTHREAPVPPPPPGEHARGQAQRTPGTLRHGHPGREGPTGGAAAARSSAPPGPGLGRPRRSATDPGPGKRLKPLTLSARGSTDTHLGRDSLAVGPSSVNQEAMSIP